MTFRRLHVEPMRLTPADQDNFELFGVDFEVVFKRDPQRHLVGFEFSGPTVKDIYFSKLP